MTRTFQEAECSLGADWLFPLPSTGSYLQREKTNFPEECDYVQPIASAWIRNLQEAAHRVLAPESILSHVHVHVVWMHFCPITWMQCISKFELTPRWSLIGHSGPTGWVHFRKWFSSRSHWKFLAWCKCSCAAPVVHVESQNLEFKCVENASQGSRRTDRQTVGNCLGWKLFRLGRPLVGFWA